MKTAMARSSRAHSWRFAIFAAALLLGSCAVNPDDTRSVLAISRGGEADCGITLDGRQVAWESNGAYTLVTENGGDYEIACTYAPAGMRFASFKVGVESVSELVYANPLRLHVQKTSVSVTPLFAAEGAPAARPEILQERSLLPEGIILP